jgi:hypothetical protein
VKLDDRSAALKVRPVVLILGLAFSYPLLRNRPTKGTAGRDRRGQNPKHVVLKKHILDNTSSRDVHLAGGGGCADRFTSLK